MPGKRPKDEYVVSHEGTPQGLSPIVDGTRRACDSSMSLYPMLCVTRALHTPYTGSRCHEQASVNPRLALDILPLPLPTFVYLMLQAH
jgi:hypothetical protein